MAGSSGIKLRNRDGPKWRTNCAIGIITTGSGDFIVEMIVHSLDMMSWAMGDKMPAKATGTGGRQSRVDEKWGNIYDHFAIEYEYENGARGFNFCRQQNGCSTKNTVEIFGTRGTAFYGRDRHEIIGEKKWQYEGEKNDMFQTEHDELFASFAAVNQSMTAKRWPIVR